MNSSGHKHTLRSTSWPVRRLVWPFVLLLVVISWTSITLLVRSERSDALEAAITRSQDRATLLEQHVSKTLQFASLASLYLGRIYLNAENTRPRSRRAPLKLIDEPLVDDAGMSGMAVWDRDGNTLAASGVAYPARDRPWAGFEPRTSDSPELAVTGPHPIDETAERYVLFTRRVMRDGEVSGYIALFFSPNHLLNFPIRTRFDVTDLVSVIELKGMTLARREGNVFSSGEDLAGGLVMRKQQEDPNVTYLGPSVLDGLDRYFSLRTLDEFPIFVAAGVSHAGALARVRGRAVWYYNILSVLTVVGLLVAWRVQRESDYRERKAAELNDTTRRLLEAQRIGKIGDWEYDLASGTLRWSAELCEMYERPRSDDRLTFADFAEYVVREDRARVEEYFADFKTDKADRTLAFQVVLPSGRSLHRCLKSVADADADDIATFHGTDQDISQEHRFRELEMQVAYLDRQGAMSMMAGTLAHELNQPLTAASNYITGALRMVAKTDHEQTIATGMHHAQEQIHEAAEIIRGVRKMVQVNADTYSTANVDEVIKDAINLLCYSGFDAARSVRVSCEPDMPDAMISRTQLKQVLINLLKNAIEAAPADDPQIAVRASRLDPATLRIEISDNGPGFPGSPVDAFSPFYTDKTSGLGLGLSITRTIIEHHAGRLAIEKSEPGQTVVAVWLRLADAETARELEEIAS